LLALSASVVSAQDKPLTGDFRITGAVEFAPVLAAWQAGFEKQNPAVHIVPALRGRASAQYGLEMRTAGVALMDRALNPFELYGTYERSWVYPVQIELGTEGAYAIYVHPSNPLRELSIEQLDGIFGAQRDGGWDRLSWIKSWGRGADRNLRTWGQLGVTGRMARQPIRPYGEPSQGQGAISGFQNMVLQGGAMWNEDYREYDDSAAMFTALKRDPLGIAFAPIGSAPAGLVALAIAPRGGGAFVSPDAASISGRSYPLARPLYAYFTRDVPGGEPGPVAPVTRAFIRYALSAEGQAAIARNPRYAALPASMIATQLDTVNSDAWPVERPKP
jgi:phosphate transport system substrate-binding protein